MSIEPIELEIEEVTEDEILLYVERYAGNYFNVFVKKPTDTHTPNGSEVYKVRIPRPVSQEQNPNK